MVEPIGHGDALADGLSAGDRRLQDEDGLDAGYFGHWGAWMSF